MMNQPQLLHVAIHDMRIDPISRLPILVLSVPEFATFFPLWIGMFEANAIALERQGIVPPRPMTHDVLKNLIQAMGGTVARVGITDRREETFIATVFLTLDDKEFAIDARPSDAFALALRCKAPMFVDSAVLARLGTFDDPEGWYKGLFDVSRIRGY